MSGTAFDGLLRAVRALVPETGEPHVAADTIPTARGSYLLALELEAPLAVTIGKRAVDLAPGLYVYSGSARGPGGLRARLGRHLRGDGKSRWHIDQVTALASRRAGFASIALTECDLIGRLSQAADFSTPIAGFGSSDCTVCASHFLRFRPIAGG